MTSPGPPDPTPSDPSPTDPTPTTVTVYWRPGCGFCAGLMRALDRHDLAYDGRNIWEDEDAAAHVRALAGGNETVPTVTVGDRALVNPSADQVLGALAEVDPDAVPDGWLPREPGAVGRTLGRLLGG